ncbi:hypothetical protein [Pseudoroseomonas cervicalis]|uniref:hypothetical protein n=1 Tax=Teichococcus cervicalis TaxID=204525 RepID=UPI0022F1B144|nr:hypothetical protein [Pseudoroseomonas cervicalis]WBV41593.1 hypothetical protein PFY06_10075 [Pseudoroseomonas cervicalis]
MRNFWRGWLPVALSVSLCIGSQALAQGSENCGDILRYASRDYSRTVSYNDQRKYFYNSVCRGELSGFNVSFRDANQALGLSYSSKENYCSEEKKFDEANSYNQSDSNRVVTAALETYAQCRALEGQGIITKITTSGGADVTAFQISIYRTGSFSRSISTITVDDPKAVDCSFKGGSGDSTRVSNIHTDVNYVLPENGGSWSLSCARNGNPNASGDRTYPRVRLIVGTTAPFGGIAINFEEMGSAGSVWANDLRSQINARIDALNSRVSGIKIVTTPDLKILDIASPKGERGCDNVNQFVYWFKGAEINNQSLDIFRCATVQLVVPPPNN